MKITVKYLHPDGQAGQRRTNLSLENARTWAQLRIGVHPRLFPHSDHALGDDGGKITITGATLDDVFPQQFHQGESHDI